MRVWGLAWRRIRRARPRCQSIAESDRRGADPAPFSPSVAPRNAIDRIGVMTRLLVVYERRLLGLFERRKGAAEVRVSAVGALNNEHGPDPPSRPRCAPQHPYRWRQRVRRRATATCAAGNRAQCHPGTHLLHSPLRIVRSIRRTRVEKYRMKKRFQVGGSCARLEACPRP